MQKWEYKSLLRSRELKPGTLGFGTKITPWDRDIEAGLPALGESGWELVAIVPQSSSLFGPEREQTSFTTGELWVFKRPKPQTDGAT